MGWRRLSAFPARGVPERRVDAWRRHCDAWGSGRVLGMMMMMMVPVSRGDKPWSGLWENWLMPSALLVGQVTLLMLYNPRDA